MCGKCHFFNPVYRVDRLTLFDERDVPLGNVLRAGRDEKPLIGSRGMFQDSQDGGREQQTAAAVLRKIDELLIRTMVREGDQVIFRMSRGEHHDLRGGLNALGLLAYLGEIEAARNPSPSPRPLETCGARSEQPL